MDNNYPRVVIIEIILNVEHSNPFIIFYLLSLDTCVPLVNDDALEYETCMQYPHAILSNYV